MEVRTQAPVATQWTFENGECVCVAENPDTPLRVLGTHAEAGHEVVWVWTGAPEYAPEVIEHFDPALYRERFNDGEKLPLNIAFYPASVLQRLDE